MQVYIYTHDPMLYMCYSRSEAEDFFGECDEFLVEIPDHLFKEFEEAKNTLYRVSDELKKYKKGF